MPFPKIKQFCCWKSLQKVALILQHIGILCALGSTAFMVASYMYFCTRLDFISFFYWKIYCTWLFVVPSDQSSYCCFELFQVLMKMSLIKQNANWQIEEAKYVWQYFSFYVIHNEFLQDTLFSGSNIFQYFNIFHSMSIIEFLQDTLLPSATWKEVLTFPYHWLSQWLHWGCKVLSMIIDPTALWQMSLILLSFL